MLTTLLRRSLQYSTAAMCLTLAVPGLVSGQQAVGTPHRIVSSDSLVWRGGNGLELATVYGDPAVPGRPYGVMMRLQPGRWIAPHWHPHDKQVVVISGRLLIGMGETLDTAQVTPLMAGNLTVVPATTRHFEGARETTLVLLSGIGPLATYPAALPDSAVTATAGWARGATSVDALRDSYLKAYNSGSADAMDDLYAESAVRLPYDAPLQEGRSAIVAGYRAAFAARTLVPTLRFVVAESDTIGTTVVERGSYHEELVPRAGGQHAEEDGKYLAVMERGADGRWRYRWSIFNRDRR